MLSFFVYFKIDVTGEMIDAVLSSRSSYMRHLEEAKKKEQEKDKIERKKVEKRKADENMDKELQIAK